jgi:16S rRNA (cytosine967-C5)-methyltransferase
MAPFNALKRQNPRQIAARILQQRRAESTPARRGRQRAPEAEFTEDLLARQLALPDFPAADRRLCQELVYGVVRWQAALDWLIARKTAGRAQKPALLDLLRLGLYQIFRLDRIPPHAAVHETVELARSTGLEAQAGFINAVLRGYLREFDQTKKLLADLKKTDPAVGYSHPEWLVAKWLGRFGAERARLLLEWNNTSPQTFARVNTLAVKSADLADRWSREKLGFEPFHFGAGVLPPLLEAAGETLVYELKSHPPLESLPSFRDGCFYIQDPGTLLAPALLDPRPGDTVLDLCAAPGGKTSFIAQLMQNRGRIVASDVSDARLQLLRENNARLGVTCVEPILISSLERPDLPSAYDRVLVDAPCSNTGVMRRRVDLRWRIQPAEITRLAHTQLDLLRLAAGRLKPGGVLVYSTCSLEPEENQQVVEAFRREHQDFKLDAERELLPFADQVDGAYVARLCSPA